MQLLIFKDMLKHIFVFFSYFFDYTYKICDRLFMYIYINRFKKYGKNVKFHPLSSWFIYENISIGDDVHIGERASFKAYIAKITIGNKVLFGPNVTIRGGIHPYYIVGRFIYDIGEHEKNPTDDQDVTIGDDVWVGGNVTILKGVVLGRGCIVAAGAVVSKSVAPYTIVGGVPAKKISNRFKSYEETIFHDKTLFPTNNLSVDDLITQFKM